MQIWSLMTSSVVQSTVAWHKIKNISANIEAMLLKLSRDVAPYKIYQMVHILMLLWQHARFQSPASSKLNITICDSSRQNTWSYLRRMAVPPSLSRLFNIFSCTWCPVQLQIIIFDLFQRYSGIGGDILNFVSHHCTCTTGDVISDQICIIGKSEYLWNKTRYHKKKNAILL